VAPPAPETVSRWPTSGTLAVDRAREVARTCWTALHRVDPEAAEMIAWAASEAGEGWLAPQRAQYGPDDWVSVSTAADLVGRSVEWVYRWVAKDRAHRAIIGSDGLITVRVGTIHDALAESRTQQPRG